MTQENYQSIAVMILPYGIVRDLTSLDGYERESDIVTLTEWLSIMRGKTKSRINRVTMN